MSETDQDWRNWIDAMILISLEEICGDPGFYLFMANWRQNDE